MPFWSGQTLSKRLPSLISPYDAARIDCAAYTLRVGSEAYISPTTDASDPNTKTKIQIDNGKPFTIPPGQFAFLLTKETVTVPPNALAFISIKARKKFKGLVNVSGFHVDPGYSGKLIFSVYNAGPATIHLEEGEPCFLIWYADLDQRSPTDPVTDEDKRFVRSSGGFNNIPPDLINPITGEILSLASLRDKIDDTEEALRERIYTIERDHAILRTIFTVALTLSVGLGSFFVREWIVALKQQDAQSTAPADTPVRPMEGLNTPAAPGTAQPPPANLLPAEKAH